MKALKPSLTQVSMDAMLAAAKTAVEPRQSFSKLVIVLNPSGNVDTAQWAPALRAVYDVMKSGRWLTLAEIAFASGYPEASVSARIRDLKNRKGLAYQKRKAKEGKLYEYRLVRHDAD